MAVLHGPLAIDFEQLWKEGMLDWHGNMPERMKNDALEEAFWAQSMQKNPISKRMHMPFQFMRRFVSTYLRVQAVWKWAPVGGIIHFL